MIKFKKFNFTLFTLLILILIISGCSNFGLKSYDEDEVQTTEVEDEETENKYSNDVIRVYMLGRSVLGGWFEHWGSDTSNSVQKEDYVLIYKELDVPPEIVESAKNYIDEIEEDDALVFFKFCFDDFWGGSKSEAKDCLSENNKYLREVYDYICQEKEYKLIVGNALPKVKMYSDPDMIWTEREFNKWLVHLSRKYKGEVFVFDQYSILSNSKGYLKKEYAISSDDSHLNDSAYEALDGEFFELLKQVAGNR